MEVLQTSALPLGYGADVEDLDWPTVARRAPARTIFAGRCGAEIGAGNGIRTRDFDLGKVALYH